MGHRFPSQPWKLPDPTRIQQSWVVASCSRCRTNEYESVICLNLVCIGISGCVLPARALPDLFLQDSQSKFPIVLFQEQNDCPEWGSTHAELSEALVLKLLPGSSSICWFLGAIPSWRCVCPSSGSSGAGTGGQRTAGLCFRL